MVLAGLSQQDQSRPYEVILVDNNTSVGDIDELYRRYLSRLELTLVRQPKLAHPMAQSRARNLGMRVARHEWIINLDADSVPGYDYLLALGRYLGNAPSQALILTGLREFIARDAASESDIVSGRIDFGRLPRIGSPSNYGKVQDRRVPHIFRLERAPHPWSYIHGCNCVYRRDDALRIGGFDEVFDGNWGYEDIDFAHRMITLNRLRPGYVGGMTCFHLDSPASAQVDRQDKRNNVNWHTLIQRIPGYAEFKRPHYEDLNAAISV